MSERIDYLKKWKHLYSPPQHPVVVDVPPIRFLMLDGHGDPNTAPAYQEAIKALYGLAYTLKFAIKKAHEWVERGRAGAMKKKGSAGVEKIRFEEYSEGLCAQLLHIGPYAEEGPNIRRLHEFIEQQGYTRAGKHREIYLSDARLAAPEKLRTVIRQPVAESTK